MAPGFSLIEVLISLLLLSFVVLGFDAMQIYALHQTQKAYFFSVAENQLNSMTERLRATNQLSDITSEVTLWNKQNNVVLPHGHGGVAGIFPNYNITLSWGQKINFLSRQVDL